MVSCTQSLHHLFDITDAVVQCSISDNTIPSVGASRPGCFCRNSFYRLSVSGNADNTKK